ncbi:MAG: hypothetical protein QME42_07310 [bacterium]|nr:hypothetical protein [bacterium]
MEDLRKIADSIDDPYLHKIAIREVSLIEDGMSKWLRRAKDMADKGWCSVDDKRELYNLLLKESEEVQKELVCVDFWVERWKAEGFHQRMLAINKELLQRRDRQIKVYRFFVMSKDTFSKDRVKEIIRSHRRELISESNRAEIIVISRNEFKEWQPVLCRKLQHMTVFDESLAIVELTDQFGESTGIGPVIGRRIKITEEERREKGIQGGVDEYVNIISELKTLSTQRNPSILRII